MNDREQRAYVRDCREDYFASCVAVLREAVDYLGDWKDGEDPRLRHLRAACGKALQDYAEYIRAASSLG